uniref:ENTH domain-containing protein n=1 Tax=Anguilla anguilla TaxID=7936 RepID=A0A0E9PDD9_ANGAN
MVHTVKNLPWLYLQKLLTEVHYL